MVVRRSDARRRRLVVDPSQSASQAGEEGTAAPRSSKSSAKKKDVRAYSYGADRRNVNKTTDLFPKRVVSYLLAVFVLLATLGLINYGAIQASQWKAQIGDAGVSSLAISGHGSVASWFGSFLLILCSLASLQIFALRKHRCDDYRGTYRLWIWMAGVLLVASLCCIVNLGSIVAFAIESLAPGSFSQKPWLVPTIVISLLTILVARAVYEVRRSRGSMTWMGLAWAGYTAAILLQLPAVRESVLLEFGPEMVAGNCVLVATTALLMAHLTYVRFIFLRAHGLIKLKAKKKKVAKPKAKVKTKAKAKAKSEAKSESKESKQTKSKSKSTKSTSKSSQKTASPSKSKTDPEPAEKKVAAKKTKSKKQASPVVEEISGNKDNESQKKKSAQMSLKEMAAASRAKTKASRNSQSNRDQSQQADDEYETEGVIKMSKAQRKKLRKQQRNRKRAA